MIYPPGQGKSGELLMQLWRAYLEQYADSEGDPQAQMILAAECAVDVLTSLARTLDNAGRYAALIGDRTSLFQQGRMRAEAFPDRLLGATFSIYNAFNTLAHQFTEGDAAAAGLIGKVDEQVHASARSGTQAARSAAALRACFFLITLMTMTLDEGGRWTPVIRQLEQRFAAGAAAAVSDGDSLLHALYRLVEMTQLFALLTDPELKDQVNQIAARFKEEDQARELGLKLRNGFCRLFELGHLLVTHVDAMV